MVKTELLSDITEEEAKDLHEVLLSMRLIRSQGGWGSTETLLKGGELDQVKTVILGKPRTNK